MTASCASMALQWGFTYFALQNGGECWAGNDRTKAIQYSTSNTCNMNCATGELCGGSSTNMIYSYDASSGM
jgi:hypothetical protein